MLLTITSTTEPATDLGFLLHKNPAAVRTVDLAFGKAHVFYPEATDDALHGRAPRRFDPVGLVRRGRGSHSFSLADYVERSPLCRLVVHERRDREALRHRAVGPQ